MRSGWQTPSPFSSRQKMAGQCVSVNNAVMKWQPGRAEHARELPAGGGEPGKMI